MLWPCSGLSVIDKHAAVLDDTPEVVFADSTTRRRSAEETRLSLQQTDAAIDLRLLENGDIRRTQLLKDGAHSLNCRLANGDSKTSARSLDPCARRRSNLAREGGGGGHPEIERT